MTPAISDLAKKAHEAAKTAFQAIGSFLYSDQDPESTFRQKELLAEKCTAAQESTHAAIDALAAAKVEGGGHTINCKCHTNPEVPLCERFGGAHTHEHPYIDPRCTPKVEPSETREEMAERLRQAYFKARYVIGDDTTPTEDVWLAVADASVQRSPTFLEREQAESVNKEAMNAGKVRELILRLKDPNDSVSPEWAISLLEEALGKETFIAPDAAARLGLPDPEPGTKIRFVSVERCPECLKLEAQRKGEALVARLGGTGWKVRVWENLGWHYEVYRGPLAVHPSGKEFICYLSDDPEATPPIGALPAWSEGNTHRDPRKAVLSQLASARKYLHQITRAITIAEGGRDPGACPTCERKASKPRR